MHVLRRTVVILAAVVAVGACSGAPPSAPNAANVTAAVEKAIGVKLVGGDIPADARNLGALSYLSNQGTMATDRQGVSILLFESDAKASAAKDTMSQVMTAGGGMPPGARVVTHRTIFAIYFPAPGTEDKGAAFEAAIKSL